MPSDRSLTLILRRFTTLLAALRDGPLSWPDLLPRLGDAYPRTVSARPMVQRDVKYLRELGIEITISSTRPPVYTLRGGAPRFSADDLRALALIRDTFGDRHPQAADVRALLDHLTAQLGEAQQQTYQRRQTSRAPLNPAIDYTPHAALIARLETAISRRQLLEFSYQPTAGPAPTRHLRAEPHEIEYHDRHFYLVAYSYASRQVHEFRIDRIRELSEGLRLPPDVMHERRPITFRYRLAAVIVRGGVSQRFENQRIVKKLPNGDAIIEAEGYNEFFIVRTLLKYAAGAELLWPEELRQRMAEEVAGLARVYGVGGEGGAEGESD